MAEDKKIFAGGGMDMDTEERFIKSTDYRYALNCRITSSDEENEGAVENIRGNKLVGSGLTTESGASLDDDAFKVIGHYEDLNAGVVYYFVAGGPNGTDSIFKYNPQNELIENVLQNNILNFNNNTKITAVNVLGDDQDKFPQGLLYWTDDENPPRKINIDKAILGQYPTIDEQTLNAIKYPPKKVALFC